jgi:hypothetical protein
MLRIDERMLYLTDNGATYCGAHLGYTARATGRDLSGQRIQAVTRAVAREAMAMGYVLRCESCGRTPHDRVRTAKPEPT